MIKLANKILAFLAKVIVSKYKPKIIGITGSVGKTSSREAIFSVVSRLGETWESKKNFNNEIGLPLAVFGVDNLPEKNLFRWFEVILKACFLIIWPYKYPKYLILEMGVDHPGDMNHLIDIAKPNIAVITSIGISHYEYFESEILVAQEKWKIGSKLEPNEYLILNADSKLAMEAKNKMEVKTISFGVQNPDAEFVVTQAVEKYDSNIETEITVKQKNGSVHNFKINAVGRPHIYAVTCALTVSFACGQSFDEFKKGILNYKPTAGRLNILKGINGASIIDDSYNAAPASTREALELLARFPAKKRIAVLGDMRELGSKTIPAHEEIGDLVNRISPDLLVTVGVNSKIIASRATYLGFDNSKVRSFKLSRDAIDTVKAEMEQGTVVLFKGSQNTIRLEKIVKEVMLEKHLAKDLLVRQNDSWLND